MRTHFIKPGFEFVFALSLIAMIGLPPIVFAQDKKDLQISITNGDTVVNGKNIKELPAAERKQAIKDIDNLGNISGPESAGNGKRHILIRKRNFGDNEMAEQFRSPNDTTKRYFKFKMDGMKGNDSVFTYRMDSDHNMRFGDREWGNGPRREMFMEFRRRNSQSFDFTNTGSDGISTHISFRVTDPSPEKLKELGGSDKDGLDIKDLNLVPEFSSGKITLMFSLPSHAIAEVKLTDHDGKLIWSDKAANGSFNKSFALGLNGIYFLQVKQAGKVAVKRIVKEE